MAISLNPETDEFCPFCKKKIEQGDLKRRLPGDRYGHEECCLIEDQKVKTPEQELDWYIMCKWDIPFVAPGMKRNIEKYRTEYNFTYSGMLRSLRYFFDVKKMPFDKNKGVGIIPFIYQEAYNYYYSIWLANQKNEQIDVTYKPKEEIVKVAVPAGPRLFKKLFLSVEGDIVDEQ